MQAPLGKVDFEQLARSYELAGGSIRNAVRSQDRPPGDCHCSIFVHPVLNWLSQL